MSPAARVAALLLALVLGCARAALAQPLVADLSSHEISITTGFAGTELLLFGATEGEGDVIVVVRGPAMPATVRRKSRVLGIWINTDSVRFEDVPSFYRVASSRPLDQVGTPGMRQRHQIGIEAVKASPPEGTSPGRLAEFRAGLVRAKLREGLWDEVPGTVAFMGPKLFRTAIQFPPNVPTGIYNVEVFLVKDGREIGAQTSPMRVKKTGIGARVYEFAHRHPASHGLVAVLLALAAGWAASVAFRRS